MFNDKAHLLKLIKMDLGIYSITLPITDKELIDDIIIGKSLKLFELYFPERFMLLLNLDSCKLPDIIQEGFYVNRYEIPDIFGDRTILSINNLKQHRYIRGGMYAAGAETIETYQLLALGQGLANLASALEPVMTFKFIEPRFFELYNQVLYNKTVSMELNLSHSKELYTIPPTSRDVFYELALVDIKLFLYNNLKYYSGIETALGRIDLKIDEWSGAEAERKEMIERFKDTYHLDGPPLFYL